jgi:hypothetical protein
VRDTQSLLGKEVRDKCSGFTGIAVARTEYLYCSDRILIVSRELQAGRPVEEWFDAGRIELIGDTKQRYGLNA